LVPPLSISAFVIGFFPSHPPPKLLPRSRLRPPRTPPLVFFFCPLPFPRGGPPASPSLPPLCRFSLEFFGGLEHYQGVRNSRTPKPVPIEKNQGPQALRHLVFFCPPREGAPAKSPPEDRAKGDVFFFWAKAQKRLPTRLG